MFFRKKNHPQSQAGASRPANSIFERAYARVLIITQKVTEVFAFIMFIACLAFAGSLFFYGAYFFVVSVLMEGVVVNHWHHVVSGSLHFVEIALIAMMISLLAPIIFRFYRYCALGETEKLQEVRPAVVERWIGSILITVVASGLLEKLIGKTEVSISTYLGGFLIIVALGLFIFIMRE